MMERAGEDMDAISLHDHTVPGTWEHKGAATDSDAARRALTRHTPAAVDGRLVFDLPPKSIVVVTLPAPR